MLITIFSLMVGSGISELSVMEDIEYLRDNLMLSFSEEEAGIRLKEVEAVLRREKIKFLP